VTESADMSKATTRNIRMRRFFMNMMASFELERDE